MRRKRSEASGPLVNPIRSQLAQSALNAGQYFPPSIAKVERCRKQNIPYNIVMIVWDQLSGREAREGTTRRTEESDGLFCAMQKLDTPSVRAPTHTHTRTPRASIANACIYVRTARNLCKWSEIMCK